MKELNLIQGSPEWLAARTKYFTASEANPMMGESKYQSRSALLKQKATGITEDVDAATKARFDNGHETEAACRPLAEEVIGAELYPVVAIDDSEKFLASSDGVASKDGAITWLPIGWEHKALNASLAELVKAGIVPDSNKWQLVHQCMVFGFEKILFSVSDGTRENHHYCWFVPTAEDFARLEAGWDQFALDLANYQHVAEKPAVVGKAPEMLPALHIEVTGMVTASNLAVFKDHALAVFSGIKTTLQTDDDFADAEKTVKWCKEVEDRLDAAKQNALGQTASIDELFRTIDSISAEARRVRLDLDKKVKAEKENRKLDLVRSTTQEFQAHCDALTKRVGVPFSCPLPAGDAIKGLKTLDSMRDKLSTALANAKIEANAIADRIEANRKTVEDMSLLPDFAQVCTKAPEDFAALLAMRVAQRKAAEEKRLEQERERIRAEEQAKAQREANEKAAAEIRRLDAERQAAEQLAANNQTQFEAVAVDAHTTGTGIAQIAADESGGVTVKHIAPEQVVDHGATIKLGEICTRLGFNVTADFLASLGVSPVATEKNAKLYPAAKFPSICRLISDHVLALAFKKAA